MGEGGVEPSKVGRPGRPYHELEILNGGSAGVIILRLFLYSMDGAFL